MRGVKEICARIGSSGSPARVAVAGKSKSKAARTNARACSWMNAFSRKLLVGRYRRA